MQMCTKCKVEKEDFDFWKSKYKKSGFSSWCRQCTSFHRTHGEGKEKVAAYNKSYNAKLAQTKYKKSPKGREKSKLQDEKRKVSFDRKLWVRSNNLKRLYGITLDQYKNLVSAQGNECAICKIAFSDVLSGHVDHCHTTGTIRGVLCGKCNAAIGLFSDNTAFLQSAIYYLESNKG